MFKKYSSNKEVARAMALYISFSILGPLLVFGAIGYIIDRVFETRFALLTSILIAYIISNILMFGKLKKINRDIDKKEKIEEK
jgi:F0F1-type ATP synthase assembly protein I